MDIYTDGACSGNPGPGGSAFIVIHNDECVYKNHIYIAESTNNISEMVGMISALAYILSKKIDEVNIYCDSQYVVNGINEWLSKWKINDWKSSKGRTIENIDLWKNVDHLLQSLCNNRLTIFVNHVDGHSGNKWNDMADKIAKETIKQYRNGNTKR